MFRPAGKLFGSPRFRPSADSGGGGGGGDHGGMDIDAPAPNPHGRLADFAIGIGHDGPSRKRHHGELGATVNFQPHPTGPVQQYDNSVPFIFYSNRPVPPAPPSLPSFKEYDSSTWQGMNMDTFNTLPVRQTHAGPDVDMDSGAWGGADAAVPTPAPGLESVQSGGEASTSVAMPRAADAEPRPEPEPEQDNKEERRRPIAKGALSRVRRRREREWRSRDTDSEGEEDDSSRRSRSIERRPLKSEHTYHHHHNVNSPGMRHSEIPALLLGYLQFFVNASIVLFILYLVGLFVMTVRRDVNDRMSEASVEIMQEIAECSQLYLTNRCDPAVRVPAMEGACKAWDVCMHRDPTAIGRTNVMVETFASVINSFVEQISWRTMGFALVTLSFLVTLANSALFNLRQNASHEPHVPVPVIPPTYPPNAQHLPWLPHGHGHGHAQSGLHGQVAYGQPGHQLAPPAGQSDSVRQIGWEGEKKKGWLW